MCELCNFLQKGCNALHAKQSQLYKVQILLPLTFYQARALNQNLKTKKMCIKKILQAITVMMLLMVTAPSFANSVTVDPVTVTNTRVAELTQRMLEIKAMNKSELTRTERKNLRNELREAKKEMKVNNGGIYLSLGAIIIIILILILIL